MAFFFDVSSILNGRTFEHVWMGRRKWKAIGNMWHCRKIARFLDKRCDIHTQWTFTLRLIHGYCVTHLDQNTSHSSEHTLVTGFVFELYYGKQRVFFFRFSHFREYHYDFMDKMVLKGDEMTFSTIQVMFALIWEHEFNVPHTHLSPQIRINFLTALFSLPHDAHQQNSSINFRKPNNCLRTMCKYR